MVTLIGAVFLLATVAAVIFKRSALLWILSASFPFVATSAITIGENSIPPFYVVAAVICVGAAITGMTRGGRKPHPSTRLLFFFTVWSLFVTLFAPRIFKGIPVLVPRGGIDEQILDPGVLEFTASHWAQCLYLILGVGVVYYIAQRKTVSPHTLTSGFAIGSLLCNAKLVMGEAFPSFVFDNYAGLEYWGDTSFQGATRFRGIFPEPSYLAVFALAAVTFFAVMTIQSKGKRRFWYLLLMGSAVANVALTYSGTAIVGVILMVTIAALAVIRGILTGRTKIYYFPLLIGVFVAIIVLLANEKILATVGSLLEDKQASQSFTNRTASDQFSIKVLGETLGFGAGLGSNRPSSMFTMMLSCVGIVGTILFVLAIYFAIKRAFPNKKWHPTIWALVALLIAKVVAEPALSTPLLWIALGLCVYAAHEPTEEGPPPSRAAVKVLAGGRPSVLISKS